MKLFLATMGSRGDFDPFLNFAIAAKARGYAVTLAVTSEFVDQVKAAGVEVIELAGSVQEFIQDSGVSPTKALADFKNRIKPMMLRAFHTVNDAIIEQKPDFVIYHPKILSAPLAAAKVGAKSLVIELAPLLTPTKEFGAAGIGSGNYGVFNKLTYRLIAQSESLFSKEIVEIAKQLGVANKSADHNLCLVSPSLIKEPGDWPATSHLVGQWSAPTGNQSENQEVLDFVRSAPTAYFGFGSMASGDARNRTRIAIDAARAAGMQALVVTGWGGLADLGEQQGVMTIASAVHDKVLPLVEVAVHHGGAGTVHSVVRAGTPSVVVPFIADQPWWGAQLHRLGIAPKPIPQKKLNASRLATALSDALGLKSNALEISHTMRQEDGLARTWSILERIV